MSEADSKLGANVPTSVTGNDTRTRKTVLLHGNRSATPAVPVSDPMAGRDTDTGNLEVLEDTKTRRTVKLKPLSPMPRTPAIKLADSDDSSSDNSSKKTVVLGSGTQNGGANPEEDTKTRKNIVLPMPKTTEDYTATRRTPSLRLSPRNIAFSNPKDSSQITPAAASTPTVTPTPAAAPTVAPTATAVKAEAEVTATKKTMKLPPLAKTPTISPKPETTEKPVATVAPVTPVTTEESEEDTATRRTKVLPPVGGASGEKKSPVPIPVALKKPAKPVAPVSSSVDEEGNDEENSKTMRISRPFRAPKPPVTPGTAVPPVVKTAVATPPPTEASTEPETPQEVKTPESNKAVPPPPKVPKVPSTPVEDKEESAPEVPESNQESEDIEDTASKDDVVVVRPSLAYTIIAAITLLFVIGSSTLITLHYLKFSHKIDVTDKIPGLPNVK